MTWNDFTNALNKNNGLYKTLTNIDKNNATDISHLILTGYLPDKQYSNNTPHLADEIYKASKDVNSGNSVFFRNKKSLFLVAHGSQAGTFSVGKYSLNPEILGAVLKDNNLIPDDIDTIFTISCYGGTQQPATIKNANGKDINIQSAYNDKNSKLLVGRTNVPYKDKHKSKHKSSSFSVITLGAHSSNDFNKSFIDSINNSKYFNDPKRIDKAFELLSSYNSQEGSNVYSKLLNNKGLEKYIEEWVDKNISLTGEQVRSIYQSNNSNYYTLQGLDKQKYINDLKKQLAKDPNNEKLKNKINALETEPLESKRFLVKEYDTVLKRQNINRNNNINQNNNVNKNNNATNNSKQNINKTNNHKTTTSNNIRKRTISFKDVSPKPSDTINNSTKSNLTKKTLDGNGNLAIGVVTATALALVGLTTSKKRRKAKKSEEEYDHYALKKRKESYSSYDTTGFEQDMAKYISSYDYGKPMPSIL